LIFPNLLFAIAERRLAHYELCSQVGIERTRFSRCLNGLDGFSFKEKQRITESLGYSSDWLFKKIQPPPRIASINKPEMAEVT